MYDANELRSYLKPILDKIEKYDESFAFRVPVDPVRDGAPVCFCNEN